MTTKECPQCGKKVSFADSQWGYKSLPKDCPFCQEVRRKLVTSKLNRQMKQKEFEIQQEKQLYEQEKGQDYPERAKRGR